ncbi:hypothetical protein ADUPG1_010013 [Aduncisulcus paluster]|uniref:Tail specific protease domain-containing protein n=2 Tax=Aduncisulcus paluster TaxID=2918883 RepID=A0ABQ5KXK1_9EUKA|nr:hypothetical protein ADUPG1_010013 [Aduncisulcus paluster]|eukprot:gnl/Carplike_NY0171/8028_a11121_160.p1 GENE.gnl/Carplike_NY0171/8028_a11121_160~~gnl/Carplike_NY0171/8028_a11121_160.p1  ORF type:complete len:918 (+),score=194.96 gnl/Carplike_NY0171/8028_a11121_160:57-2810(+)
MDDPKEKSLLEVKEDDDLTCSLKAHTAYDLTTVRECLNSIPFDQEFAETTIQSLLDIIEMNVFLDILQNPPQPYESLQTNVQSKIEQLRDPLTPFTSEYDFHNNISDIFNGLHDPHSVYVLPLCYRQINYILPVNVTSYVNSGSGIVRQTLLFSPLPAQYAYVYAQYEESLDTSVDSTLIPSDFYGLTVAAIHGPPLTTAIYQFDEMAALYSYTSKQDQSCTNRFLKNDFWYRTTKTGQQMPSHADSMRFYFSETDVINAGIPYTDDNVTDGYVFLDVPYLGVPSVAIHGTDDFVSYCPRSDETTISSSVSHPISSSFSPHAYKYAHMDMQEELKGAFASDAPWLVPEYQVRSGLISYQQYQTHMQALGRVEALRWHHRDLRRRDYFYNHYKLYPSVGVIDPPNPGIYARTDWKVLKGIAATQEYTDKYQMNDFPSVLGSSADPTLVLTTQVRGEVTSLLTGTDTVSNVTYAVLRISSFSPSTLDEFADTLISCFDYMGSMDPPVDKLIVDVRSNGGGYVSLGYKTLKMISPYDGQVQPELNGQYSIRKNDIIETVKETYLTLTTHYHYLSGWKPFIPELSWFDEAVVRDYKDVNNNVFQQPYSQRYEWQVCEDELSDEAALDRMDAYVMPAALQTLTQQDIMIVSDGLCGSTCATFAKHAQESHIAKMVNVGGIVQDQQTDKEWDVASFAGGSVLDSNWIFDTVDPSLFGKNNIPRPFLRNQYLRFAFEELFPWDWELSSDSIPSEFVVNNATHFVDFWPSPGPDAELNSIDEMVEAVIPSFDVCGIGEFLRDDDGCPLDHGFGGHPCEKNVSSLSEEYDFNMDVCQSLGCEDGYYLDRYNVCSKRDVYVESNPINPLLFAALIVALVLMACIILGIALLVRAFNRNPVPSSGSLNEQSDRDEEEEESDGTEGLLE